MERGWGTESREETIDEIEWVRDGGEERVGKGY